jgi:hypothetical protein
MFLERFSGIPQISRHFVAVSRHACRAVATLAVVVAAGCATPGGAPVAPAPTTPEARQAVVAERANARWAALIKDDMETAYGYLSPASRQVTSLDKFKASLRRGAFRAAEVKTVVCDAEVCKVGLLLTYDHRMMKGITTPLSEAWIFEGGQAWYVN